MHACTQTQAAGRGESCQPPPLPPPQPGAYFVTQACAATPNAGSCCKLTRCTTLRIHAQAPQREKVSNELIPSTMRPASARNGGMRQRRWVDRLRPDVNMGVPQLMQILEPNIIWERARGYAKEVDTEVEAKYCPGDFFEGWHRNGKLVRFVLSSNGSMCGPLLPEAGLLDLSHLH